MNKAVLGFQEILLDTRDCLLFTPNFCFEITVSLVIPSVLFYGISKMGVSVPVAICNIGFS